MNLAGLDKIETRAKFLSNKQASAVMYILAETLDDILLDLYPAILESGTPVDTTRSPTLECIGVSLEIKNPRARLSRTETRGKPFSCLGELLWYLTKDNKLDFIKRYIPLYYNERTDENTVYGGYGPRLFNKSGINQIDNVIRLLSARQSTRRAAIQIFDAEDINVDRVEIPCTNNMQFLVRDGLVNMVVTMRSNDAYRGLPHDVYCFTMIQEIIARSIGLEVGTYRHFAASMHLYTSNKESVEEYIGEKVQPRIEMPPMPAGDPWKPIRALLEAEARIRDGQVIELDNSNLDPYWADLVRLLQIFDASGDRTKIAEISSKLHWKQYQPYVESRNSLKRSRDIPAEPYFSDFHPGD